MIIAIVLTISLAGQQQPPTHQPPTPPPAKPTDVPHTSTRSPDPQRNQERAIQVALDRAEFSPGALDGSAGKNTKKALNAHRKANGGNPQPAEPLMRYRITEQDAAGP